MEMFFTPGCSSASGINSLRLTLTCIRPTLPMSHYYLQPWIAGCSCRHSGSPFTDCICLNWNDHPSSAYHRKLTRHTQNHSHSAHHNIPHRRAHHVSRRQDATAYRTTTSLKALCCSLRALHVHSILRHFFPTLQHHADQAQILPRNIHHFTSKHLFKHCSSNQTITTRSCQLPALKCLNIGQASLTQQSTVW